MGVWLVWLVGVAVAVTFQDGGILLHNAANPGTVFPWVGLGTGGYGMDPKVADPECWSEVVGCGKTPYDAMMAWWSMGGKRVDDANSYFHQNHSGMALKDTTVSRGDIFLLTKVGPTYPLGYNDTMQQVDVMKRELGTPYVDSILIHWPTGGQQGSIPTNPSVDPKCNGNKPTYDEIGCLVDTYRALVDVWKSGYTRSVGVSNFNTTHILALKAAGLPLPAINQRPFNPHREDTEGEMRDFCNLHQILFNGYSPLGVPDLASGGSRGAHVFPPVVGTQTILEEPAVKAIATKRGVSPAQVLLAWHWAVGVPTNPRTRDPAHMKENLESLQIKLTPDEVRQVSGLKEDYCDQDPEWYECAARNGVCPPQCCSKPPCPDDGHGHCCGGGVQ